ncbi:hypothetical protein ABZ793_26195 [Micromonospora sp. NPDC047465]|uniref:hypothetical protein n=1 Tax=Micromonospora sp. NPDC047465 TaxID=3154813 RepID=UPI0033FAFD57
MFGLVAPMMSLRLRGWVADGDDQAGAGVDVDLVRRPPPRRGWALAVCLDSEILTG